MTVRKVTLVCAHGVQDGHAHVVDRFVLRQRLGGLLWFPTMQGHRRVEQLVGDDLQTYPLTSEPSNDEPLRNRYAGKCSKCGRPLQLRDENLQALLNAAAAEGRDTLRLDRIT